MNAATNIPRRQKMEPEGSWTTIVHAPRGQNEEWKAVAAEQTSKVWCSCQSEETHFLVCTPEFA